MISSLLSVLSGAVMSMRGLYPLDRSATAPVSAQALVVLGAGGAAREVGPEAGQVGIGILALQLQVHVLVEQLEALLAGDLEPRRAQQGLERFLGAVVWSVHAGLPSSSRSFFRAS